MTRTELRQSDTELLLFIHASQKERAKRIEGRRWDPKRRCWVYPKTALVYDALVAEFGDDLVPSSVPHSTPHVRNASREAGFDIENGVIEKRLRDREHELEEARHALEAERGEVERLREINAALETKVESSSTGVEDLMNMMQEMKEQQGTKQFAEVMPVNFCKLVAC